MIVGLGGGIGATRLWTGLAALLPPSDLTLVVNTADDFTHRGLRICPDIDTTIYGLAGVRDEERGWGLRDESWRTGSRLAALGETVWFNLGDLDLATHLLRSGLRAEGATLTEITTRLARAHGVAQTILPMSDSDIETWVTTAGGEEMHYQEYLVRRRCALPIVAATLRGAAFAVPAPGVLDAIRAARLIVLGPSNPVASLHPILSLQGVARAIAESAAVKIAVTPTVHRVPITDPAEANRARSREQLLALDGIPHRPAAIAALYRGLVDCFVLDRADRDEQAAVEALGMGTLLADTLIPTRPAATALARRLLAASTATA